MTAIRKTGRFRNRRKNKSSSKRRFGKKKNFKSHKRLFQKMSMPRMVARTTQRKELKYYDVQAAQNSVPQFLTALGASNAPLLISMSHLDNYAIPVGITRSSYTGNSIRLLSHEINFDVSLNPANMPTSGITFTNFNADINNYQPRFRVVVLRQKNGNADGLPNINFPNYAAYGFNAPWDIDRWHIISDKSYTLGNMVDGAVAAGALSYNSNNAMKFIKNFKIRIPLRMAVKCPQVNNGGNLVGTPDLPKYYFIVINTEASYFNPNVAYANSSMVQLTNQWARVWFKDT